MHAPSYVLAPRLLVFAFAEPDHRLPRRIEEFRRDGGDLVFRQPGYRRQHLVEALIRLAVHRKARQTIHPCCRTLQREHQLSLRLLLRLGERVSAQPLARQLGVLLAMRAGGLRRRLRLGADVHARHPHLAIEARERVNRVGEPQLLADPLEQAARHPAAEYVRQDDQGVLAGVGLWVRVGGEHDVGLGGVLVVAGFGAADGGREGRYGRRYTLPVVRCPIEPPQLRERFEQLVVRQVPRPGDDAVRGEVRPSVQLLQVGRRERADGVARAEDGVPVGMLGPQRLVGEIEHLVVGSVFDGVDLLEHHLALELQVAGAQHGVRDEVGEHRERAGAVSGFSSSALRESRMRPRSSTSSSLTRTWSPFFTTSSVRSVRPCCSSEMCSRPSTPGRISMNAPNAVVLFTTPSYTLPTSGTWTMPAMMSRARSPPSPTAEMVTSPLSSTLISAPVCSWIDRMVFPLGPMMSPILSVGIWIVMMRGAYLDSCERGCGMARSMMSRMWTRACLARSSASAMILKSSPSILMSIWIEVTPSRVPATLKSMSPR